MGYFLVSLRTPRPYHTYVTKWQLRRAGAGKSKMTEQVSALIVAEAGQLGGGLHTLLKAIPRIDHVTQVSTCLAASQLDDAYEPALLLLDFSLCRHEVLAALQHFKIRWPRLCCVALIDVEQERQAAQLAGFDVVLVKGILATKLVAVIEELLPPQRYQRGI
jgi:DNA-binding NarL/FixJ family response regulator